MFKNYFKFNLLFSAVFSVSLMVFTVGVFFKVLLGSSLIFDLVGVLVRVFVDFVGDVNVVFDFSVLSVFKSKRKF
jgi:hypothetical protein